MSTARANQDLLAEPVTMEQDFVAIAVTEGTLAVTASGAPMRQRIVLRPIDGGPERVLAVSRLQDGMVGVHLLDVALTMLDRERA